MIFRFLYRRESESCGLDRRVTGAMTMGVLPWCSSSRTKAAQERAILAAIVICSSFLSITSATQDVQQAPSAVMRSPQPHLSSSSLSALAVSEENSMNVPKTTRIVDWKSNRAPPSDEPSPVGEGRALRGLPVAAGGLLAAAASAGLGLYHGLNSGARSILQPGTIGTYVQDRIGQFLDFVSPSGRDLQQEFSRYERSNAERPQRRSFGSEHRGSPAAANLYPAAGNAPILTANRRAFGPNKKVMKRGIPLRRFNVHGRAGGLNKFYKPYGKLQKRQQFAGYGAAYQNYLSKPFGGYQQKKNPYGFNPAGLFGAGFPGLSQDSSSVESFFMTSGNMKTLGIPDKKYPSYYSTPSGLKATIIPAGSDSDSGENKQYIPKAPSKKYAKGTIVSRESSEEHSVKTYGKYSSTKGPSGSKSNRKGEDSNSHEHLKTGHKYLKHLKHIGHLTGDDSSNDRDNSDDKPCVNGNCNDNSDSDERGMHSGNPAAAGSSAAPVVFHGPNLGFNFEGNKGGSNGGDPYGYSNKANHVGPSPMLHFYFFPENSGEDVKQVIRDQAKLLKTRPPQSDENDNSSDNQKDSNEDSNDDASNGSSGTGDSSEPQFGGYYIVPSPKKSTTKGKGYTIKSNSKSHGDHDSSEEKTNKYLPSAKYKKHGVKGRNTKGGDDSNSSEERGRKQSSSSKSSKYDVKGKSHMGNDDISNSHEAFGQPPPVYYLVETKNGKSVGSDSDSKEQPKVYQILPSPSIATPNPHQDDSDSNEGNKPKSYYKTKVTHTVIQPLPVSAGKKYYHHGHQDSDSQELTRGPNAYSKSASASKNKKPKSTTDSSSEENTKAKTGKSSKSPKQPVFVKLDPKNGYKIIPISDSGEESTEKGQDSSQSQETAGFRPQTPAKQYASGPVPPHSIQAYNVYYATHPPQQPILANYPTVPLPWPTTPSPQQQQRPSSDSSSEENNNRQQSAHINSVPKSYNVPYQQYGPPPQAQTSYTTKGSRDQSSNKSNGLYRLKVDQQQHSGYRQVNKPDAVQHYGATPAPESAYKLIPHQQPKLKQKLKYSDSTERSRPSYPVTTQKLPVYKPAPTARPYTQQNIKHHITYNPAATIVHQTSRPSHKSTAHEDNNKVWLKSSTTPYLQAPQTGTQSYPDGQLENVHQIIHASEESARGQKEAASILGSNQGVDQTLLNAHKDFGPAAAQPSNKDYNYNQYGKEAGKPAILSTVDSRDKKTRTAPAYYNHGPTHTPVLTSVPVWGEFPVPSGTTPQQYQQTEKPRLHKFTSQEAKDLRSSEEITAAIQDFTKQDVPGKAVHYQTSKQSGFAYTTIVDHSQRRNAETTASSEVSAIEGKDITANCAA